MDFDESELLEVSLLPASEPESEEEPIDEEEESDEDASETSEVVISSGPCPPSCPGCAKTIPEAETTMINAKIKLKILLLSINSPII